MRMLYAKKMGTLFFDSRKILPIIVKMKKCWGKLVLAGCAVSLFACGNFRYAAYTFGALDQTQFRMSSYEDYYRQGEYSGLKTLDKGEIPAKIADIYSYGPKRKVLPSTGKTYLTVIPVDFVDVGFSVNENVHDAISEAFFGDSSFNQYVSLAEYYDKSSYHRLQVEGEVTKDIFRCPDTYASLLAKANASQTKSALTRIYNAAIEWYNQQDYGRTLTSGDAVYFVYLAPYSGMEDGRSARSSMMWAFTVNDPAPICWSSYYMMHVRDNGAVDAHTYIHEFGHMLGLRDYYDANSYSDLSACSPLGRMDMMDCSLGEHNAFSKMMLDWMRPYVPTGECEITLRPSSGNGDALLLPLTTYNGTPYDEYLLLEYYTPSYLNAADATLRTDPKMSLMKKSGIKAYHVDGRLAVFDERGKTPVSFLGENVTVGNHTIDFYYENSGYEEGGYIRGLSGFMIHLLDASSKSMALVENYIASDHNEDIAVGGEVAHLRDCLFNVNEGVDLSTSELSFHKNETLSYGFKVTEIAPTHAKISVFPLSK